MKKSIQLSFKTIVVILFACILLQTTFNGMLFLRIHHLEDQLLSGLTKISERKGKVARVGDEGLPVGSVIPTFHLEDQNKEKGFIELGKSQYHVLMFSSTHCSLCTPMYNALRRVVENQQNFSATILMYGPDEDRARTIREQNIALDVRTLDEETSRRYKVEGTPFFYIIDNKLQVITKGYASTEELLDELIDRALVAKGNTAMRRSNK